MTPLMRKKNFKNKSLHYARKGEKKKTHQVNQTIVNQILPSLTIHMTQLRMHIKSVV